MSRDAQPAGQDVLTAEVVNAPEDLVSDLLPRLAHSIQRLLRQDGQPAMLLLDCRNVRMVDTRAVEFLLGLHTAMRRADVLFGLTHASPVLRDALDVTQADRTMLVVSPEPGGR